MSRTPAFVRDLPQFSAPETHAIDLLYRKRIRSLQAVDRGVARLVHTLRVTKQLDNTYIVFASDNGFHLGQHRMPAGKQTPYEPDIHVPADGARPRRARRRARHAPRGQHRPRADVRGDGRARTRRRSPTAVRCSRCCTATEPAHWRSRTWWSTGSRAG